MRLKVCQIIPTLVRGGAEKQMSYLAQNLDADRFESHVIVLTHSGPLEQQLRDSGVKVHIVGKRHKLDPTCLFRLTRTLKQIAPDIVHTWLFAANSYGRLAARNARVPVIVCGERCVDPWKTFWHHAIDRRMLKYTDTIVTNTSAVVDFYGQHGIEPSSFTVIPNAVVPDPKPTLSRAELFRRLDIEPRARVVGAVGRLWKQKGYEDLIWAGELLRVAHEDVCFVIIGDGPEREHLLHFRDQSHAHHAVRLVGHREDAAELMTAFDVLWNGSLYEGQSNTILEAMSAGVPVIASDIPGNRDLVRVGETGFLFALGDVTALTRQTLTLLNDEEQRKAFGASGRECIAKNFSLQKMVQTHEDLYLQLSKRSRHR